MGISYEIGLQAGKRVAEKVDSLISQLYVDDYNNFDPVKKKTSPNGTATYHWCEKWNRNCRKLEALLHGYDDESLPETKDEEELEAYAYKLIAYSDEDVPMFLYNSPGFDFFSIEAGLLFPDSFYQDDAAKPVHDIALIEKTADDMLTRDDIRRLMDALNGDDVCYIDRFPTSKGLFLTGFATAEAVRKLRADRCVPAGCSTWLSGYLSAELMTTLGNGLLGPRAQVFKMGNISVWVSGHWVI